MDDDCTLSQRFARPALKAELQIWHTRKPKDGTTRTLADEKDAIDVDEEATHALVLDRYFDRKGQLENVSLTVNSGYILTAFREAVGHHPTVATGFDTPFSIDAPFEVLIHYWDELHEYRDTVDDDDARMYVGLLLQFMRTELHKS